MALQISIMQGKALPAADADGKSDPYVELYVNGITQKTKTIKGTLNPYWGETFVFREGSFNPNTDTIRMDVYDWDRFSKNDLLTRNLLSIAKYAAAGTTEEWVALNTIKGGARGTIQIKVVFGDGRPKIPPQQQQQQQMGGYPPQQQQYGGYPPQQQGGYPPQQQFGGYPPQQGGYPPQQQYGGYPPQQQGGYPPQQQGGYPPQQQGGYPSQQQGGFGAPPQSGGIAPPQQQQQRGFGAPPPQQGFGGAPPQQGLQAPRWSGPTHGLPPNEVREAEEAFWRYDADRSGTIDRNELKPLLRAIFGNRMSEGLMDRYASAHFQSADSDRSGQIDFGEFLSLYSKLKPMIGGGAARPGY